MAAILTASISKRARVTVVKYAVYENVDGSQQLVEQKPLVFKGLRDKSFAKKQLTKLLGDDADFIVTGVEAGEHLYCMSVADFIRNATVVDGVCKATGEPMDPGQAELAAFGAEAIDGEADEGAEPDNLENGPEDEGGEDGEESLI